MRLSLPETPRTEEASWRRDKMFFNKEEPVLRTCLTFFLDFSIRIIEMHVEDFQKKIFF